MAVSQRSKLLGDEWLRPGDGKRPMLRLSIKGQADPEEKISLLKTIESEIVPRLMLALRDEPSTVSACAESRLPPTAEEVAEFARIATCHDLAGALGFVETICRQGLSLESVLIDLIGPTARLLGQQWEDDHRSFSEVSAGLGTLQQVVHVLGPSFAPSLPHRGLVVLTAPPGEQHTLGLHLAGEFLRRAGWGVQINPNMTQDEVIQLVASERVVMLGITVSNDELLESLAALIAAARKASCNQNLAVMLGGPLDLREFAIQNGASLYAADARDAVRWLEFHANIRGCLS